MPGNSQLKRGTWSDQELVQLGNRYPHERAGAIAEDLGRPLSTVYAKANSLGMKKNAAFLAGPESGRGNLDKHRTGAWTEEQLEIFRARYPHEKTEYIAAAVGRSVDSLYSRAAHEGLKKTDAFMATEDSGRTSGRIGLSSRFMPGHVPVNKGKKGMKMHPNAIATQFPPGHVPANLMQIGDFRLAKHEHHWFIKVSMTALPSQRRFLEWHKFIWMQANGDIPPKHIIRIRDWKKGEPPEAVTLDRLECISMAENMLLNSIHRYPKRVVDVVMQAGRLQREINKQKGEHNGKKR